MCKWVGEFSLGEVQLGAEGDKEAAGHNAASGHQCYEHSLGLPPGCHCAYLEPEDDCEPRLHIAHWRMSAKKQCIADDGDLKDLRLERASLAT